jgi:hypothetical protein
MRAIKQRIFGPTTGWLLLLLLLMILYFWKILLTHQFSILINEEDVRQWYSWLHFCVANIKHGGFPLWDSFTGAGTSFAGEMQTGAFNPLNLILALIPFNQHGMLSPMVYNERYVLIHFFAACFMFALARELKLSRFSALIAGICFSLGGFIIHSGWRHIYESAIWLPLIVLFLLRAIGADNLKKALLYASASGLMLGMAALAGGLHVVIMQAIVIFTLAAFAIFQPQSREQQDRASVWKVPIFACLMALAVGFLASAVQLFPSMEYGSQVLRWISNGVVPATTKIPYRYLSEGLAPHSFIGMFFANAVAGKGEVVNPYMGVFPLIAAVIGVMKCWNNLWVRYLTGLAVASFLYALGEISILHGLTYAMVPGIWMAREAGRFIYLASFAISILAAFGIETLFCTTNEKSAWTGFNGVLAAFAALCGAALVVNAVFGKPDISIWTSFSILMILVSVALFQFIIRGHTGMSVRILIVGLVLFDLSAFDWTARNPVEEEKQGRASQFERLMSYRGTVEFLKTRPVPYRVKMDFDERPNIGHVFQIPTIDYSGATALKDYNELIGVGNIRDLLNTRYIIRPASASAPNPLYQDSVWKVYDNPDSYPAAWIVHDAVVEPTVEGLRARIDAKGIDFHRTAALKQPLESSLEQPPSGAPESATYRIYKANSLELDVETRGRGLLVLSEMFYPGWSVKVNGKTEKIYKVNGLLRGIVVPEGQSRVVLRYAPVSIYAGGILTVIAFSGTLVAFVLDRRKRSA